MCANAHVLYDLIENGGDSVSNKMYWRQVETVPSTPQLCTRRQRLLLFSIILSHGLSLAVEPRRGFKALDICIIPGILSVFRTGQSAAAA